MLTIHWKSLINSSSLSCCIPLKGLYVDTQVGVVKRILTTFLQYNDRAILYIILPWWIWKSQFSSMLSMLQHQFMDYLISPATHQVSNLNILTKKSLSEVRISWFILCQAFKVSSYSCNCFCSYSWQAPVTVSQLHPLLRLFFCSWGHSYQISRERSQWQLIGNHKRNI